MRENNARREAHNKCLLTTPTALVNKQQRSKAKLCEAQNHLIAKEN